MTVNCDDFMQGFVSRLAGTKDGSRDESLDLHAASCATCREATSEMTHLWSRLGEWPDAEPSPASRARFEAMLEGWSESHSLPARARTGGGFGERLQRWLDGLTPQPASRWIAAAALVAFGFFAGAWFATRGGDMDTLRRELQSTRSLVALSLLQQRSPTDRLQGIGWSTRVAAPDSSVIDALFDTLDQDPSVDVRLAAVEAIGNLPEDAALGTRVVASLRQQESPLVQLELIEIIVRGHYSEAQPVLQDLSTSPRAHRTVRERAQTAQRNLTL
jgi:hypothetical protein